MTSREYLEGMTSVELVIYYGTLEAWYGDYTRREQWSAIKREQYTILDIIRERENKRNE